MTPVVPALPPPPDLDTDELLSLLAAGKLEVIGRLPDASNVSVVAAVSLDGMTAACVYKPVRGERPLWDFRDGTLADREVATYLMARDMGWSLVPPTVLRDGPLGMGMCQVWIPTEDITSLVDVVPADALPAGWFAVVGGRDAEGRDVVVAHANDMRLRRMAVFDAVVNNADRKGGHLLLTGDGALFGVDHGVCLHVQQKLRTLLWGWAGQPLPAESLDVLTRLAANLTGALGERLGTHLTRAEVTATVDRTSTLLRTKRHPRPGSWPAIPWPPF